MSGESKYRAVSVALFTVLAVLRRAAEIAILALLCVVAWRVAQQVNPTASSVQALSASAQKTLADLDQKIPELQESVQAASASVNATARSTDALVGLISAQVPGVSDQVKADLQETHRLILESGLTAMEARKASAEERAALPAITAKATRSLDDLHAELGTLQTTTRDLDTLVNDPANAKTLKSLSDGSAALAATAQDGQQFVHGLIHPTWPHKVWGVVLDIAHVFNPL